MRYLKKLERKDLALNHSMISLGSCTMKLNAATEMLPLSLPEWADLHPFAPVEQAAGYHKMLRKLEADLSEITGFAATSLILIFTLACINRPMKNATPDPFIGSVISIPQSAERDVDMLFIIDNSGSMDWGIDSGAADIPCGDADADLCDRMQLTRLRLLCTAARMCLRLPWLRLRRWCER